MTSPFAPKDSTTPDFLAFESNSPADPAVTTSGPTSIAHNRAPTPPLRRTLAQAGDPSWLVSPRSWDVVTLQNSEIPGICKVKFKLSRKLEINSPPNSDGATVRDRGYEPARVSINVRIWTEQHYEKWAKFYLNLISIAGHGNDRKGLYIFHPSLSNAGIGIVYLESVSELSEGHPRGVYECTLTFVQIQDPSSVRRNNGGSGQNNQGGFVQNDALTAPDNPNAAANTPAGQGAANAPIGNIAQARR